jgi:hypothetical protein
MGLFRPVAGQLFIQKCPLQKLCLAQQKVSQLVTNSFDSHITGARDGNKIIDVGGGGTDPLVLNSER